MKRLLIGLFAYKQFIFLIIASVVFILTASLIPITFIGHSSQNIAHINSWFYKHHDITLVWHVCLLLSIYIGWSLKIKYNAKKLPIATLKKLNHYRWLTIVLILLIDIFTLWNN